MNVRRHRRLIGSVVVALLASAPARHAHAQSGPTVSAQIDPCVGDESVLRRLLRVELGVDVEPDGATTASTTIAISCDGDLVAIRVDDRLTGKTARFDKAFPVYLAGDEGMTRGIARNIGDGGMFIETREPYRLGSRIRVTFVSPDTSTEITITGEVRYQCFLSYGGEGAGESQLRGMGVRFVEVEEKEIGLTAPLDRDAAGPTRVLH